MARIDQHAMVDFQHIFQQFYSPFYVFIRFNPHPLALTRPLTGRSVESIVCPTCGQAVVLVIHAVEGTAWRRRAYGLFAVITLASIVALYLFVFPLAIGSDTAFPALLLVAVFALLIAVLFRSVLRWLTYPGADIKGAVPLVPKRHRLVRRDSPTDRD